MRKQEKSRQRTLTATSVNLAPRRCMNVIVEVLCRLLCPSNLLDVSVSRQGGNFVSSAHMEAREG